MARTKSETNNRPQRKTALKSTPKKRQPAPYYVVCIGASAGGLNAVCELVAQLPAGLNATIFIVFHLSKTAIPEILAERIRRFTSMPCEVAADGSPINAGCIYIGPPDAHLL